MDASDRGADQSAVDVSIVIPAYNEQQALPKTLDELAKTLAQVAWSYEVIVVDDGSSDKTFDVTSARDDIRLLQHRRNRGYGAALKTGVTAARGDIVVWYDADNQFEASDIVALVDRARVIDAAIGARTEDSYVAPSRRGLKWLLAQTANYMARQRIPDLNCGLRAVRREILLGYLHLLPDGFSASTTTTMLLLKEGYDLEFIPVTVKRRIGTSTVRPIKDGLGVVLLLLRLTTLLDPFRVFGPVALVLIAAGSLWAVPYVVLGKGLSVAALFLLLGGLQVFFFGLLADQVAALRRERRYVPRR